MQLVTVLQERADWVMDDAEVEEVQLLGQRNQEGRRSGRRTQGARTVGVCRVRVRVRLEVGSALKVDLSSLFIFGSDQEP